MKISLKSAYWRSLFVIPMACNSLLAQDEPTELEAFISEEVAAEDSDSLLPTDRSIDSAFFDDMSILDTPRAVLTLSPEVMKQFNIEDFGDLDKIGASTDRYNFYGIPGSPTIRGWQGGIFFNGMLRAYQLNEMPTSFGSLEAMNVVKGPAPAHYIATHIAGYADMLPKSPYFDEFRGSAELEIGTYGKYRMQVDAGSPFLLGDIPAAYRVSITGQLADSYYDDVSNDFYSVYLSAKVKLSDTVRIFTGGEYYNFKSNENAGWNRPTQNLIDNGEYVIGEALSLVRPDLGVADRDLLGSVSNALVVSESVVSSALSDGTITADQVAALVNMSDPTARAEVYTGVPADVIQTDSGYLYTPEYFSLGGTVFTEKIEGSTVLSDPNDFADSEDMMFFFDVTFEPSDTFTLENKLFVEALETDKLSSYGYSFRSEQEVIDDRLTATFKPESDGIFSYTIAGGVEARYSHAIQLQDFWAEPFARRDITAETIDPTSIILSGAQVNSLTGQNYWGGGFGAGGPDSHAGESDLTQLAIFGVASVDITDYFSVLFSARREKADFDVKVPDGPTDVAYAETSGDVSYTNWSINPIVKLNDMVSIYGSFQEATTFIPGGGGLVLSGGNFGDGELAEGGIKLNLLDGKAFATISYYKWKQSSFSDIDSTASEYESEGIEFELTWAVTDSVTILAAFSDRETQRLTPLGFRTIPWGLADPTGANNDEIGLALESGSLLNQFSDGVGGFTPEGGTPSNNPDLIVPGSPESSIKLFAVWDLPQGFQVSGGGVYRSSFWHNYDHTLKIDSSLVLSANLGWSNESWEVFVSVENLLNEDYYLGADPSFAANTLISKAPETEASITFKYLF
jgi:iron complex outermembrane receptor protein